MNICCADFTELLNGGTIELFPTGENGHGDIVVKARIIIEGNEFFMDYCFDCGSKIGILLIEKAKKEKGNG